MQGDWAFCPHCGHDNRPPEQRVKLQCQECNFDYGSRCINCGQGVQQGPSAGMLSYGSSGGGGYGSRFGWQSSIGIGFLSLFLLFEAYDGIVEQRISLGSRRYYSPSYLTGGAAVGVGVCFLIGGVFLIWVTIKALRSGW
jgi:hypothetical protein